MSKLLNLFRKKPENNSKALIQNFEAALGENLHSLIQYGSSVKGSQNAKSDLNLLIVLQISTPEAHSAIYHLLKHRPEIDPFILGMRGIENTFQSFAIKFLSIKRHYKVLSGEDILAGINIPLDRERFLAEQALRNLRLKLVHAFVIKGPNLTYLKYVISIKNAIFIDVFEVPRCDDMELPVDYLQRITMLQEKFSFSSSVLKTLYTLPDIYNNLSTTEIEQLHGNLFLFLDNILSYVEKHWNGK